MYKYEYSNTHVVEMSFPRRLGSIPRKKRHVSKTSRFKKMSSSASDGEEHEDACGCYIRPAEEWVLPADPGNGGDDDRLGSMVRQYWEVKFDRNQIRSTLERL